MYGQETAPQIVRQRQHQRLQHAIIVLYFQLGGHGLWTLSRGLAGSRQRYFACLAAADRGRQSYLDGRGALSDAALAGFCAFFLQTVLDQIQFMTEGSIGTAT